MERYTLKAKLSRKIRTSEHLAFNTRLPPAIIPSSASFSMTVQLDERITEIIITRARSKYLVESPTKLEGPVIVGILFFCCLLGKEGVYNQHVKNSFSSRAGSNVSNEDEHQECKTVPRALDTSFRKLIFARVRSPAPVMMYYYRKILHNISVKEQKEIYIFITDHKVIALFKKDTLNYMKNKYKSVYISVINRI